MTRRTRGVSLPAADRRVDALLDWMARLLRLLPDATSALQPGRVDSPEITLVSLAAVEERAKPLQRTAPSRRTKVPRGGRCRFTNRVLAHVRSSGGPTGTAQSLFRLDRSSPSCRLLKLNSIEPPWYVTRMPGGVGGAAPRGVPLSRSITGRFASDWVAAFRRNHWPLCFGFRRLPPTIQRIAGS